MFQGLVIIRYSIILLTYFQSKTYLPSSIFPDFSLSLFHFLTNKENYQSNECTWLKKDADKKCQLLHVQRQWISSSYKEVLTAISKQVRTMWEASLVAYKDTAKSRMNKSQISQLKLQSSSNIWVFSQGRSATLKYGPSLENTRTPKHNQQDRCAWRFWFYNTTPLALQSLQR